MIGSPVAHSISPHFQQAAFDQLGLPWRYEAWETGASELAGVVASLRAGARVGANVTVPHKEAVLPLLDALDPSARATGAVNVIVRRDERLTGHNTDVSGFIEALREDGGFEPGGAAVAVLGAGGAARAVVVALLDAGAASVTVQNRNRQRADQLVAALDRGDGRLRAADGEAADAARDTDLIVNCTTLGMAHGPTAEAAPLAEGEIPPGSFVCDIVANPAVTPLLALAAARGCRTLGGLPMLVRQGAAAFTLWTGRPAPLTVMLAAAERAMRT